MIRKWSMLAVLLLGASLTTGCVVEVEPEDDTIELNEDYALEADAAEIEEDEDEYILWDGDMAEVGDQLRQQPVVPTGFDPHEEEPGDVEGSFGLMSQNLNGGDNQGPDPQPWHREEEGPDPQPWKNFEQNHAAGPDPQPW